jgi:ketosteroid isomerase-like protein/predicted aspartyl protease
MEPTQALPEAVTVPLSNARYNMSDSSYSVYIEGIDSGLRGGAILHPPCSGPSMKPTSLVALFVLLTAPFLGSARAQTHEQRDEIPIERCDRLPVVTMKVAGENRRFLLDTGATTMLNLKSFTSGASKQIQIYSWSGGAATSAREVVLLQVELGTHKLRDLKLPAIDLSPIGKACRGQIDGILGVDLLDQMGMTIDFKRQVAVPAGEPVDPAVTFAEMERDMGLCDDAFNHGDEKAMAECLDPDIILYTPHGEFPGRQEVVRYLADRYFKFVPKLHFEMKPHDVRTFGDALWYSYDYSIDTPEERIAGRGMSMCRKDAGGRWRILNMHNSRKEEAPAP